VQRKNKTLLSHPEPETATCIID